MISHNIHKISAQVNVALFTHLLSVSITTEMNIRYLFYFLWLETNMNIMETVGWDATQSVQDHEWSIRAQTWTMELRNNIKD